MILRRCLAVGLVVTSGLWPTIAGASPRSAIIVDRVVAVVGDAVVLRSQVIARAHSLPKREARVRELYRDVLTRMIDEILVAAAAREAKIEVSETDVEREIRRRGVDRAGLLAEAQTRGISPAELEQELRRHALERKWVEVSIRPLIREPRAGTEEDKAQAFDAMLEAEKNRQLATLRDQIYVEVRW